jgi:hypothetical protein
MSDDLIIMLISVIELAFLLIMVIMNIRTFGFLKIKNLFLPVSKVKLYSILYTNEQIVNIEKYNKIVLRFLLVSIVFLFTVLVILVSEN